MSRLYLLSLQAKLKMNRLIIKSFLFLIILSSVSSCIGRKDLNLLQYDENTVINENGLITHTLEDYRLQVDDFVAINIETKDPDADEFFSKKILSDIQQNNRNQNAIERNGFKIDREGYVNIIGLGNIFVAGLTEDEVRNLVQNKVDEIYNPGLAIVTVNVEGINFTIQGEVGNPGTKISQDSRLNLIEALALSGNFGQLADRKNVHILRQYPEGIKRTTVDLTKENIINSKYFYIQPNDIIIVDSRIEKITGLGGKTVLSDVTQAIALVLSTITTYLLVKRLL